MRRQNTLPAAYYRGGTSRAVFFREEDLPSNRDDWADPFRGVIGSPDPYGRQLDGLGGGISSLSKVCVVGQSQRPDADVDYTFVAVGVRDTLVDYSSNCGNMSGAVGPYAVDMGMVPVDGDGDVTVRIHNTNTGKLIRATFPVVDGEAAAHGDYAIDGVAGTAARVRLDFVDPAGSRTGKLLPTGSGVEERIEDVRTTCIDASNPCCLVLASDLGVDAGELTPQQMDEMPELLEALDRIRREAGVRMGLASTPEEVPGSVPKIAIVSPPKDDGVCGVIVRAISVGQPHRAIPVTVALAVGAAAKLSGSTVSACVRGETSDDGLMVHHASGKIQVDAVYDDEGDLKLATVFRTARRLMEGKVYWK